MKVIWRLALKKELRRFFINLRKGIDKEEKARMDKEIYEKIIGSKLYKEADSIFTFISMEDEVDTRRLIDKALEDNKKVYVPKIIKKRIMGAALLESKDDLVLGKFDILTSKNDQMAESPDLTIVPGLCFDREKYRLGYGGSYYDTFIKNHKSTYLGVFYSLCETDKVTRFDYDQKVDYIVTDKEFF
jgi:5-formyltetrahydrofolate cyclo-ligase